jgi:diguanylate cyclase (GGDEF)-like protein
MVLARTQARFALAPGEETPQQKPEELLESLLARLDYGPGATRGALEALEQRRTVVRKEALTRRRIEAAGEGLVLCVPLWADQRPVGVLRIRRCEDGYQGPAAETLEEMLSESAKHIALSLKKDQDDRKAITDQLTGLFIKRHFLDSLERLIAEAAAGGPTFVLAIADLDHFKKVNDEHGHLSGDLVLKGVAQVFRQGLRSGDLAFRYGGEELAVLMTGATPEAAQRSAERLRQAIQKATLVGEKGEPIPMTLSLGLAYFRPGLSGEQLISRADRALYASKQNGRNRVTLWRPDLPDPHRKA